MIRTVVEEEVAAGRITRAHSPSQVKKKPQIPKAAQIARMDRIVPMDAVTVSLTSILLLVTTLP